MTVPMRGSPPAVRAASLGNCCAAIPTIPAGSCRAMVRCLPPMLRSLRAGGCTFAEAPCRPAPVARLLWSAAFDPSVLRARSARGTVRTAVTSLTATCLAVAGDGWLHVVIDGVHHGVRVDIAGSLASLPLDRLIFPFTVAITPRHLAEFGRLIALARGQPLAARNGMPRLHRIVLGLRVIDALGEGASLRTIGEAFVRAGDWPGRGESTKSAARRLVDSSRRLRAGGPALILSG